MEKHFTVYSKPACPACVQAKNFLKSAGQSFSEVSIDFGQSREDGVSYISRDEFISTFPNIRMLPFITIEGDPTKSVIGDIYGLRHYLNV